MTVCVEVDDSEEALRNAERLRGRTIADPAEFPDKRPSAPGKGPVKFAYFADPKGAVVSFDDDAIPRTPSGKSLAITRA